MRKYIFLLSSVLWIDPCAGSSLRLQLPKKIGRRQPEGERARSPSDGQLSSSPLLPPSNTKCPSRWERYLQKLYDNSDVNHDGTISFDECYELVLRLYIKINQKAAIAPPTRPQIWNLYEMADVSHSGNVDREEFTWLATTLLRRALSRLVAHKILTLICAPLLAELLVQKLSGYQFFPQLVATMLPQRYHEKWLETLASKNVGRTILLVILISTLGNILLDAVNIMLDWNLERKQKKKNEAGGQTSKSEDDTDAVLARQRRLRRRIPTYRQVARPQPRP